MKHYPILFALLFLVSCVSEKGDRGGGDPVTPTFRDWAAIIADDTLRVGTVTSPTDFFLYRDESFGVEYRKIRAFAGAHDLELDVRIAGSPDTLRQWVERGEIDLTITPFAKSRENEERFAFAGMTDTLSLVLVQKKSRQAVSGLPDLHRRTLTVVPNSVSELRARQIVEELGDTTVHIALADTLGQEDLIRQIALLGDTTLLTLAENDLARVYARQYPQIDVSVRASVPIRYGWILSRDNSALRDSVDVFFSDSARLSHFRRVAMLDTAYKFYFGSPTAAYHLPPGAVSVFDELFKRESVRLGWDWTILAAIADRESAFTPDVIGWSGARGLMGIMPSTGRSFGASVDELLDPAVAVRVSVDVLLALKPYFEDIPGESNRIAFVLAAYNAGLGHIRDAQRLAKKYGADPTSWYGGVREYILLKSNPKYYNDPVVRSGYLRGRETVDYVDKVTSKAEAYQRHLNS